MEKFTRHTGIVAPLLRDNIDTDAIIPSREMKRVSRRGLEQGLFADWRYRYEGEAKVGERPEFVLNRPAYREATILLSGRNFGCGSSREHAVWALREYGIRAVIAVGFGTIFHNNCVRNGALPIRLGADDIAALAEYIEAAPGRQLTVDLKRQTVSRADGRAYRFDTERQHRDMLLNGLDAIDMTLAHQDAIAAFLRRDRGKRPWIYLEEQRQSR